MTDKTQTHSSASPSPEEFMKLWQEKWGQMMKEKGWPETMAMPQMSQMPFMMPFMSGFPEFQQPANPDTDALLSRITELEKRLASVEKKLTQRNKATPKK
jgi:anion-transporting  ArsA/GET3 family ATPase